MNDAEILQDIKDTAEQAVKAQEQQVIYSEETKALVSLMCRNLCADIHNYFVSMIESASKSDSGFTAEQLSNAAKDLGQILSFIEVIINRHKNFIIHNDPDFDTKTVQ